MGKGNEGQRLEKMWLTVDESRSQGSSGPKLGSESSLGLRAVRVARRVTTADCCMLLVDVGRAVRVARRVTTADCCMLLVDESQLQTVACCWLM